MSDHHCVNCGQCVKCGKPHKTTVQQTFYYDRYESIHGDGHAVFVNISPRDQQKTFATIVHSFTLDDDGQYWRQEVKHDGVNDVTIRFIDGVRAQQEALDALNTADKIYINNPSWNILRNGVHKTKTTAKGIKDTWGTVLTDTLEKEKNILTPNF